MALHTETPFVSLFGLVHLGVALLLGVLGGRGSIDNGRINYGSALEHMPGFYHYAVDGVKKQLVQTMRFQQPTELQQRSSIGSVIVSILAVTLISSVFCSFIGQIEPHLKQIHSQHLLNSLGRTTTFSAGIKGYDDPDPLTPWNDLIHYFKELLTLGLALPIAVLNIAERLLLHLRHHLLLLVPLL